LPRTALQHLHGSVEKEFESLFRLTSCVRGQQASIDRTALLLLAHLKAYEYTPSL